MKRMFPAAVILLCLAPLACNRPSLVPASPGGASAPLPTPTVGTCGVDNVTPAQAVNLLAGNLYAYFQSQPGNVFFSPFSILTAMSMAQEGANGSTACQMQTALNLSSNASVRQAAFQQFIARINNPSKSFTLDTSDDLWVQQGFNILPSYGNVLQADYAAGVTNVDFTGNPSGALQTINGAVSQQTEGYIPQLLSASNISPGTRMILTNAVYFKASWELQFPAIATLPQNFSLSSGATESVSMMHNKVYVPIGSYNGAASVIALPYTNDEASMYIFLPPLGGMSALEGQMTASNLGSWLSTDSASLAAPSSTPVDLALPKFTFSTRYDLATPLAHLGMPLAFNPLLADFSGIDGGRDLSISFVVHQAYVNVDETGTTAAAATGVGIVQIGAVTYTPPPILFIVDHPFLFAIVDNATNAVLFMGRVDDPLAKN